MCQTFHLYPIIYAVLLFTLLIGASCFPTSRLKHMNIWSKLQMSSTTSNSAWNKLTEKVFYKLEWQHLLVVFMSLKYATHIKFYDLFELHRYCNKFPPVTLKQEKALRRVGYTKRWDCDVGHRFDCRDSGLTVKSRENGDNGRCSTSTCTSHKPSFWREKFGSF